MNETIAYTPTAKKARVEIIPLIDVVFFLLATFVLFTLSLQKLTSLALQLPASGEISSIDTTTYVEAAEDGSFNWKQGRLGAPELVYGAELRSRLEALVRDNPKPRVMIIAQPKVSYGVVVRLIDDMRKIGIHDVSVDTTPPYARN